MKYGESIFDILYLLFAIISGCMMLHGAKSKTGKLMGLAALILGCKYICDNRISASASGFFVPKQVPAQKRIQFFPPLRRRNSSEA